MYARGILFGKMKYELGDHAQVRCPESGLEVNIEFKVKGWVSGSYNSIGGFIKETKTGKSLYELSGYWHGEMSIKDLTTGKKTVLFDATHAKPSYPKSRPLEEQAPRESQRLWASTTAAIRKVDHAGATEEKSKIEDEQRREAAERGPSNPWQPKLFRKAPPGDEEALDWIIDAEVDSKAAPEKQVEQILAIAPILPGQKQSEDYQRAKSLPSQQDKPLPSEPQRTKAPAQSRAQPQGNDGTSDLIDFGQNDVQMPSQQELKAYPQPSKPLQPFGQKLQEPLIPTREPGDPVRRVDSIDNNEETFLDAES